MVIATDRLVGVICSTNVGMQLLTSLFSDTDVQSEIPEDLA